MKTPTPQGLRKYQIGLAVLGVAALIMLVLVLVQAQAAKADSATYDAAQKAASKLESYTSRNDAIPDSLSAAGVSDAPDTIKYTKLSETQYKFCVTYKSSSGFSSSDVESRVLSGAYGSAYSSAQTSSDSQESSYLYISSTHKKGETCQTIKPYIYNNYSSSSYSNSTSATAKCYTQYEKDKNLDNYYTCVDK